MLAGLSGSFCPQEYKCHLCGFNIQRVKTERDLLHFFLLFSFPRCAIGSKSTPTEAPLSHGKDSSSNASSSVALLTSFVTSQSQTFASFMPWQVIIDRSQLLCCCESCCLRRVWADQSEQTGCSGGGALKRQELKTDGGRFKEREATAVIDNSLKNTDKHLKHYRVFITEETAHLIKHWSIHYIV